MLKIGQLRRFDSTYTGYGEKIFIILRIGDLPYPTHPNLQSNEVEIHFIGEEGRHLRLANRLSLETKLLVDVE